MNKKYTKHEEKKLPVHPVEGIANIPKKKIKKKTSGFAPEFDKKEKEIIRHLSQDERIVFIRASRLGITVREYYAFHCK